MNETRSNAETVISPTKRRPTEPGYIDGNVPWQTGKVLLDGYTVTKCLGVGGMGRVYLVEREITNRKLQFAVKILNENAMSCDNQRQMFIRELRTWMDLPSHPHIVGCRFFKTIDQQIAIFSEYIDGGTLGEWIETGQLSDIELILDLTIQFAEGLHAAHLNGIVHQDIKPNNVMITGGKIAKITDFGLARAYQACDPVPPGPGSREKFLTTNGMTLAYCSYEQSSNQKVDHRTDIWSWGLSILEIFTGRATWSVGALAEFALLEYLKERPTKLPPMPEPLTIILDRCFCKDRDERWDSMSEIIPLLLEIYHTETGRTYTRRFPDFKPHVKDIHADPATSGNWKTWTPPEESFKGINHLSDLLETHTTDREHGSKRAQALFDLERFENAQVILAKYLINDTDQFRMELSRVLYQKSILLNFLADYTGADAALEQAICHHQYIAKTAGSSPAFLFQLRIYQCQNLKDQKNYTSILGQITDVIHDILNVLKSVDDPELILQLGSAYRFKAWMVNQLGDSDDALILLDRSETTLSGLVERDDNHRYMSDLAKTYAGKATFLSNMGNFDTCFDYFDKAAQIWEPLVAQGRKDLVVDLANVYRNRAIAYRPISRIPEAINLFEKFNVMLEDLYFNEGQTHLAGQMAAGYLNLAVGLTDLKQFAQALEIFDKAIAFTEPLFFEQGRTELAYCLALIYNNKAVTFNAAGHSRQALPMLDSAINLYESLVFEFGLTEHHQNLAHSYANKAQTYQKLQDNHSAVDLFERCIQIFEMLLHKQNRRELTPIFADLLAEHAFSHHTIGDQARALKVKERALRILNEDLDEQTKRHQSEFIKIIVAKLDKIPPEMTLLV